MKTLLRSLLFLILATHGALAQVVGGGGGASGGGGTVNQGTAAGSGPWIVTPWIAGAVNSATNGLYANNLQGNAVLSATNGLYTNVLQGNAVLGATNGLYTNILQGNVALSATNPLITSTFIAPMTSAQGGNITPLVGSVHEIQHSFAAAASNVYSVYATGEGGSPAGYLVCVNSASAMSSGAITPLDFVAMPAGPATIGFSYLPGPAGKYSSGVQCGVTIATTPYTWTAPTALFAYHALIN